MSNAALIDDCRRHVLTAAPELVGLYIVDAELVRDLPCNNGCTFGWAGGQLFDRNIADRLGDQYTAPAPFLIVDIEAIAAVAPPGEFERYARNVALHEAAHVLPACKVSAPVDSKFARIAQAARMKHDFAAAQAKPGSPTDPHDWKFIRRATHLYYRAVAAGCDVTSRELFGPYEWMSPVAFYLDKLLSEAVRLKDATFRQIEATAPPAGFMGLWEADLRFHQRFFGENHATV